MHQRAHKNTHYLSPEVVRTFIENSQGYCGTERRCWAGGLTIWKGWCQRLCRHCKKAIGVAGRSGSGCRGADRGRGSPVDPKNMKTQLKKSLESNKPSVPPLCQGPLALTWKVKKVISLQSTVPLYWQRRTPISMSIVEKQQSNRHVTK